MSAVDGGENLEQPSISVQEAEDLDVTRMTENDKILPSIDVKKQIELEKKRLENEERRRLEKQKKQKEEEESGLNEHITNLPLELLFKQKMEKKVREQMLAAGQVPPDEDADLIQEIGEGDANVSSS